MDDGIRRRSWRWWFALIVALLLVCWSGCGGDSDPRSMHYKGRWGGMGQEEWLAQAEKRQKEEEEEERRAQEEARRRQEEERRKEEEAARQQAAARRKHRTSGQPASANGNVADQTNASASSESEEEEGAPRPKPKPTLPEAFDQWKPEHFLLARRLAPERLVEAIAYLAQTRRGDPEVVELLLDVVWSEKDAANGSGRTVSGRSQHTEAILRAVADALASQQTPKADDYLRQLLSGQTPTEDYSTLIRCVLAALAAHPSPDHDRLLLQAVLGPENLLHSTALLQAQSLQQEALRVITNQSGWQLQEQLARYVESPGLSPQTRQKIEQSFLPNRWEHFQANLVLVQSHRTSAATRSAIFRQLAVWSAQAVQTIALPDGAHRPADQLAQARQAAESIWKPEFAPALAGLLSPSAGTGADGNLQQAAVQLAMTIPASWARRLLADWLVQRWPQRPETFRKAVEQSAFEPGFLVLVGRLVYEEIDPIVPIDPSARPKSPAGKVGLSRPGPNDKVRQQTLGPVAKEWLTLWDQASARLAEAIVQDLSGGSPIQPASLSEGPSADAQTAQFPILLRLPSDAKLLTSWRGHLIEQSQKLGWNLSQDDTYIYISRWQLQDSPQGLANRLERSLLPQVRRRVAAAELVLEAINKSKETDQLQMVQIRIRPLTPEIPRTMQEEQPLLLEALCVQIAQPTSLSMTPAAGNIPIAGDMHPQKRD